MLDTRHRAEASMRANGAAPRTRRSDDGGGSLRVLTYHRVANASATPLLDPRLVSATPEAFERQMQHVAAHYRVVSLPQVVNAAAGGAPLPKRAVLLTFDDAYRDFGSVAWPILRRLRLPALLAVPTAYPDHPERGFWWDRLYAGFVHTKRTALQTPVGTLAFGTPEARHAALRRLRGYVKSLPHGEAMSLVDSLCAELEEPRPGEPTVLGWDELRRLSREGVSLCAHSRTHPLLTQLAAEDVRAETAGSRRDLQREVGGTPPVFCFPNGSYDSATLDMLRQEGFRLAFTQRDGHNDLSSGELLCLRRTNVTRRTSLPVFRLRLWRWVTYLDRWRHRARG